jgi:GT2 family glycosyltransferase
MTLAQPTLSICVPTFNRPELVQHAIASIAQSAPAGNDDVEIVVADNSPAVSEAACRRALAEWGGRSVYVGNETNLGLAGNLNRCVAHATGRFVIFVCDDDSLLPGAVPKILRALQSATEADKVLLFGVQAVDAGGRRLRLHEYRRDARVGPAEALRRLLTGFGFVWFPGTVVRSDAYAAAGPFDEAIGKAADIDMWVRLFSRHGVRCIPETIGSYSVHAGTATRSSVIDAEAIDKTMIIFERARMTRVLSVQTLRRSQAAYLHQLILDAAYVGLQAGDLAGARSAMALFGLPSVRALGPSPRWLPLRLVFAVLVRAPAGLVRALVRWSLRLDVVRRFRTAETLVVGRLPPSR